MKDCSPKHPSSAISEHSSVKGTPDDIAEWLMSLPPASPANHSASPDNNEERKTIGTDGPIPLESFAKYDPASRSWKTRQLCLLSTDGTLVEYSENWPNAGMTRSGACFRLHQLELRTCDDGSGSFPTPLATDSRGSCGGKRSLRTFVRNFPTPRASDGDKQTGMSKARRATRPPGSLPEYVRRFPTPTVKGNHNRRGSSPKSGDGLATVAGGPLNPDWVEWLMGWPIGWTESRPLETDKFREWLQGHGLS